MYESAESSKLKQSSLTWALWGILIGITAFSFLGWVQLNDPLISDALVALLAIGCVPAALAFGVALWRGWAAAESAALDS